MIQQHEPRLSPLPGAVLLVGGIDEGLQDVVHFLSRLPTLLNHLEEDVLDLSVSVVPFPTIKKHKVSDCANAVLLYKNVGLVHSLSCFILGQMCVQCTLSSSCST